MLGIQRRPQTAIPQSTPVVAASADNGAGWGKVCIGSGSNQTRIRVPSGFLEVTKEELHDNYSSDKGGQFYYHDGDRDDLKGREFLVGEPAIWKAPTTHTKLSDDPSLKAEYALHAIIGAMATLPYQPEWHLHWVLSIHQRSVFGEILSKKVQGNHVVSFGGKNSPVSRLNLDVGSVVAEGIGSYSIGVKEKLIDKSAHAIGFDLGTATCIPVVFSPGGKIIYHQPLEVGGTISLLEAIANDKELIEFIGSGKAANVGLVRKAIEARTFEYTARSVKGVRTMNFRHVYARHVGPWLSDRVRLALKAVEQWRDASQSLVAWGGSTEMPGVSKMLATQGIVTLPEGGWANCLGLQRISESLLARKQHG